MQFSSLSLVAGTTVCNARCPFCISRMTPTQGVQKRTVEIDWRNFHKAARLACNQGVDTVLITGKGEPTLYPEQITAYLRELAPYNFPFIELQTNAVRIAESPSEFRSLLSQWYDLGLTTVAISIVDSRPEANRRIYLPHRNAYIDLPGVIATLHESALAVRLAAVLCDGIVDSPEGLQRLIAFAQLNDVEQLSVRPVNRPSRGSDPVAEAWVDQHLLRAEQVLSLATYLNENGAELYRFPHGAVVYDVGGQNVCLTNCLTTASHGGEVRQLIFFPNGNVTYDWASEGAILMRGRYASTEPAIVTLRRAS